MALPCIVCEILVANQEVLYPVYLILRRWWPHRNFTVRKDVWYS